MFPITTIPKKSLPEDDLVVLPRKEYERLTKFWQDAETISAGRRRMILKGLREIKAGKFVTSRQLKHELGL